MYGPAPPLPLPVPPVPLPVPPSPGRMISGPPKPAAPGVLPVEDDAALPTRESPDSPPQPVSPDSISGSARQLTSSVAGNTRPVGVRNFEGLGSLIGSRVSRKVGFQVVNVGRFQNRSGTPARHSSPDNSSRILRATPLNTRVNDLAVCGLKRSRDVSG